jgi:hypothetical protein
LRALGTFPESGKEEEEGEGGGKQLFLRKKNILSGSGLQIIRKLVQNIIGEGYFSF